MPIRIEFGILNSLAVHTDASSFVAAAAQRSSMPDRTWIAFELLPGSFPEEWAAAFAEEVSRKSLWHFNFGSLFVDEPYYRNKILRSLNRLRSALVSPQLLTVLDSDITAYCKRATLEALLQECSAIKSANKSTGKAAKVADDLSDLVRHYLQIYHPEFHFHISLQAYVPQTYHLPSEAYALFTCDRKDGWLYLDYVGEGQTSLACFNEKSIADHEPQTLYSANSQILYRENFDGHKLKADVTNWLKSQNQSHKSIGLIPLARPMHSLSRIQIRELFAKSDTTLKVRIDRDGQAIRSDDLRSIRAQSVPFFANGLRQAAVTLLLRKTSLDLPVNFLIDCHHRYGGSFWMIKQTYYWLKPKAFRVYFTLSWPIRHLYYIDWPTVTKVAWGRLKPKAFRIYFTLSWPIRKMFYFLKFQFEKRISRSLK
jgi:hypothetical protein